MASSSRKALGAVGVLALTLAAAAWPVTTKQGVNYEVSTHRLPLFLKAFEFVDRSAQYQQIADEVTMGAASDTDKALKAFEWTSRRIKPTPDDWTVVDDHILNIITRGHGKSDQRADVFATITTYAGVRAFWQPVKLAPDKRGLILTFVEIDGRWRVFDVANDIIFRNPRGDLATLEELRGHPELVPQRVHGLSIGDTPYADFITRVTMPAVSDPLRAELQMPAARLWHELKSVTGLSAHEPE